MSSGEYHITKFFCQFLVGNGITGIVKIFTHFFVAVVPFFGHFFQGGDQSRIGMVNVIAQNVDLYILVRGGRVLTG